MERNTIRRLRERAMADRYTGKTQLEVTEAVAALDDLLVFREKVLLASLALGQALSVTERTPENVQLLDVIRDAAELLDDCPTGD